ncbi:MAG: VWA domain-containing protein, partial [Anaerolineae bacterium]
MRAKTLFLLIALLGLILIACGAGSSGGPPRNAAVVNVWANTGLTPWLTQAVTQFNKTGIETTAGKPVFVQLKAVEAGQAIAGMTGDVSELPDLWIPDGEVWVNVLAQRGQPAFRGDCAGVAQSPLVIAMWRPVAEALGWPGRSLGWLDVGSLAADPSAWDYYSGGQFGPTLRLGHTHPGLSATGTGTLLAIVQAAQSKTEAVSAAEIQQPIVQASVGACEGAVAWGSPAPDRLGQTMADRGVQYLGAAVLYESTVIAYGSGSDIVPIYPFEGTFVATHPACINSAATPAAQEAAALFRDYLLGAPGQELAVANGLRPVNPNVPLAAPLDAAHGVNLSQPETVFASPGVEAVYAVQDLWQSARKDVNLVMLLDTSGSMRGDKIENMRRAAVQFVEQMGDDDYLTLITFSGTPHLLINHQQIRLARQAAIDTIKTLDAGGGTALYDAVGLGSEVVAASTSGQASNALVVLTDGKDTGSYQFDFNQTLIDTAAAHDTTVFTIAYGSDAEEDLLAQLAH